MEPRCLLTQMNEMLHFTTGSALYIEIKEELLTQNDRKT